MEVLSSSTNRSVLLIMEICISIIIVIIIVNISSIVISFFMPKMKRATYNCF